MARGLALLVWLAALAGLPFDTFASSDLRTEAERSGFQRTGRYDEVIRLCRDFQQRYPDRVHCRTVGTTPEGRPMQVLVMAPGGSATPERAHAAHLPVVLVQGGIHAGEIDGKDAGFLLLRELLDGEAGTGILDRIVLLFVPVFNVDGHERFGRWNRPNQRGPEEMGWRTTALNYNLNRDYAKADSPEMRAMLALVDAWDPILTIDLHATDGAQFEHDIAVQVEPVHSGDDALRGIGRALRDDVLAELTKSGSLPLPFYPSFVVEDDPASGFADGVAPPRFSTGYFPLRNRFAMLVETHSWRRYPERVRSTRNTVLASLTLAARQGESWLREAHAADQRAAQLAGTPVALAYEATADSRTIAFRGYAYTRTPSEVSGALMTRYDESTPQIWSIPLRDNVQPSVQAKAPGGGYVVPAAYVDAVAPRLAVHGIESRVLHAALADAPLQVFRAHSSTFATTSSEGRQRLSVEGQWQDERRAVPAGTLFVPIAQPKSRLVMALLEPLAPDSLLAWGEFNRAFLRQEYMEPYVAEQVAREMLAADPELRRSFEKRLASDLEFATSPSQRLEFFYRRHSAWDERAGMYPILRTEALP